MISSLYCSLMYLFTFLFWCQFTSCAMLRQPLISQVEKASLPVLATEIVWGKAVEIPAHIVVLTGSVHWVAIARQWCLWGSQTLRDWAYAVLYKLEIIFKHCTLFLGHEQQPEVKCLLCWLIFATCLGLENSCLDVWWLSVTERHQKRNIKLLFARSWPTNVCA